MTPVRIDTSQIPAVEVRLSPAYAISKKPVPATRIAPIPNVSADIPGKALRKREIRRAATGALTVIITAIITAVVTFMLTQIGLK